MSSSSRLKTNLPSAISFSIWSRPSRMASASSLEMIPSLASMRHMRPRAGQVFARQALVEIDGGGNLPHDLGGAGFEPPAPHFVGAHLSSKRSHDQENRHQPGHAIAALLAVGVLYGKGLLSVHQGFKPPAMPAPLGAGKSAQSRARRRRSPTLRAAAMRSPPSRAIMCCSTCGPPGARPVSPNCRPWPGCRLRCRA